MYKIRKGGIKSVLFGDETKSTHSKPPTFRKSQRKVYQINLATAENQIHKFSGHKHRLQRYVKIQQPYVEKTIVMGYMYLEYDEHRHFYFHKWSIYL